MRTFTQANRRLKFSSAAAGDDVLQLTGFTGTEELSRGAVTALEGRLACLLANHGLIACGPSLRRGPRG